MEIKELSINNLKAIDCSISMAKSLGIAGLSGSGKSTFCEAIFNESLKKLVTVLPKSEYRFLFGDKLVSNKATDNIEEMPLVFYLGKMGFTTNPRSTVGTHTGIFDEIRRHYANTNFTSSEFFSFNNSIMWCRKCKGRGGSLGNVCSECKGTRYDKEILKCVVKTSIGELTIVDINKLPVEMLLNISDDLNLSNREKQVINNMIKMKVGYLSLDRVMGTLSGGETVRVLLAEFMAECKKSLIIIDEISIGLDHNTLINILYEASRLGKENAIWLIDHSDTVLAVTEEKLFFGPGSGSNGGNIIEYSTRPDPIPYETNKLPIKDTYDFKNLASRNINVDRLKLPKNRIIGITGESGSGKSTLINECIVPCFKSCYKDVVCVVIGQDKNQSITSKSTIGTFLDLQKRLLKFGDSIIKLPFDEVYEYIKKDKTLAKTIQMLIDLGLGYLSFNRQVKTLSTGEFQCIHLVSKVIEYHEKEMVLIFDEPSKGLSQNILNLLMKRFRDILLDEKKTVILIEHNYYFLSNCDYIIDFGKRKSLVTELEIESNEQWFEKYKNNLMAYEGVIKSEINNLDRGISHIYKDIDKKFGEYMTLFKGGVLKNLSITAQWIYKDYTAEIVSPIIVLDLEGMLYSKNTRLFEVLGIHNLISNFTGENIDLMCEKKRCKACKGNGVIDVFDIDLIIKRPDRSFSDGLLVDEVMTALKKFNMSKFTFFFKSIKKSTGYDLLKPYDFMSEKEKEIFWYGYWEETFYDSAKKTQRTWRGLIYLINKYMKSSTSKYKEIIKNTKQEIVCPTCKGSLHSNVSHIEDEAINFYHMKLTELKKFIGNSKKLDEIIDTIGDISLFTDLAILDPVKQVMLKMLELKYGSYYAYTIVLKNTYPYKKYIDDILKEISANNSVVCLEYEGIDITKEEMLRKYFSDSKNKVNLYVYELLGYKKVVTEINSIRKQYPCSICNGKMKLKEESIHEGIDVIETPCSLCDETGLSNNGLNQIVQGFSVKDWIYGSVGMITKTVPEEVINLPLLVKVKELNKYQILALYKYIKGETC